ncbi:MAG: hypothetical protein QNJ27_01535 [Simkaniaceae bacterium]|nr:hypothetical protein [Simkaniaceae bacterium]
MEEGLTLETFPDVTIRQPNGSKVVSQIVQTVQQVWQQTFGIKLALSP